MSGMNAVRGRTMVAPQRNGSAAVMAPVPATVNTGAAQQLTPQSPQAQVEECLAVAALAMGDWEAVSRHCEKLAAETPERYEAWLNLSAALIQLGRGAEAMPAAAQALRLRPSSADAHLNLALSLHQSDRGEQAMDHYRRAIQLGCTSPAANWNLALLEADTGNPAVAIEMLSGLRVTEPDWTGDLLCERGALLLATGRAAEAMECLQATNPSGDPQNQFNLGVAQLQSGRAAEALETFEALQQEAPDDVDVTWAVAAAASAAGDGKRLSAARRALRERGETVTELTFNLALQLEAHGRDGDAIRAYSEVLKERPLFAEALANMAHVLARLGQDEQSQACWKRALALRPELAEV